MVTTRRTLAVLALGSALVARPALGQSGSSVSLTHTVSVTVPPRVKVQVASAVATAAQTRQQLVTAVGAAALSLSVSATQSWRLSIEAAAESSDLEWSIDGGRTFAEVSSRQATVASGEISPTASASTLFFRSAGARGGAEGRFGEGDAVVLTVVAP